MYTGILLFAQAIGMLIIQNGAWYIYIM